MTGMIRQPRGGRGGSGRLSDKITFTRGSRYCQRDSLETVSYSSKTFSEYFVDQELIRACPTPASSLSLDRPIDFMWPFSPVRVLSTG